MLLTISGKVEFTITLDSSAWIFDDRKLHLDTLVSSEDEISFEDNKEWNRQIIEGETLPPTLKTEKQFKSTKQELLEGTFVMNLSPFLEYAEPETFTYRITHKDGVTELPYKNRYSHYAQFSKEGKRLYDDGMIDILIIENNLLLERYEYVTKIEFI